MAEFKISRIRFTWKGAWVTGTAYIKDEIVRYKGSSYVCLKGHTSSNFYSDLSHQNTNTTPATPDPYWEKWFDGFSWRGSWGVSTAYEIGDLVKYGSTVYLCTTQHTSAATITLGLEQDLSKWTVYFYSDDWTIGWASNKKYKLNDIIRYKANVYRCITAHISSALANHGFESDIANWTLVISGVEFKGTWNSASIDYSVDDIVKYGASTYKCHTAHISSENFDATKWNVYAPGYEIENAWSSTTKYQPGDLVKYGGYQFFSKTFNLNSIPSPSNTTNWGLITTNYDFKGDWTSSAGFKTGDLVRHGGSIYVAINNTTNQVPTNTSYWELLNSSVRWGGIWANATDYIARDIVSHGSTSYECKVDHSSSVPTRPDTDVAGSGTYWKVYIEGDITNVLTTRGDIKTNNAGTDIRKPIGLPGEIIKVIDGLVEWDTFGDIAGVYYVAESGNDGNDGLTLNSAWRTVKHACQTVTGPATIFIKTGTYSEVLPIKIPRDVALVGDELRSTVIQPAAGYNTSNMFYVNNGSGIRNMTLKGLEGSLTGPNQYLTRRPTAGAYVSLDPGVGPSDSSVWIINKSPYIQNVTTFGTGCTGLKIDGSLHNEGNKSVVANDFTQILSDGIGVWCTNLGLTELVSVFSYYGHIGYLAENGGRIRATNGNSSYGQYGCVSEGVDSTETLITGNVNNRTKEAQVGLVFSGQAQNKILAVEYTNAGQNYTNATFSFTGAGLGVATTMSDFRNNAIYEVRIIQASENASAGGGGYLTTTNNAQAGDATTITLASNDPNTFSEYNGMRIIIVSGTGVGQYGYIQAYDSNTNVVTVYKESDGTPGWDHIADGETIEPVLDTTTQYTIEPRVIFSNPAPGGTQAKGRVKIVSGRIGEFRILDPGEGYTITPTVTIVDPNNTSDATFLCRVGNGVLGKPTFTNRGIGYQTSSTICTISGDGYADIYQVGKYLTVNNLSLVPGPGANLTINGNGILYKIVTVTELGGGVVKFQISPELEIYNSPAHNVSLGIREKYSQVRLTGHDFLDIGTGNFLQTNYPNINEFNKAPENETVEVGGGRVFYTSTDQDGNFRVGELFKVEQSTGVVTVSADFFQLSGLEEISLGGVSIGGSAVVIREFSTDGTFTADSNNIIPTQRAIQAYLTRRISGGGSDAYTGQVVAGIVRIGPQKIDTTTGTEVKITANINIAKGVNGTMLASSFFANGFKSKAPRR